MSDIIVGLQYGDEGKGKVTNCLIKESKYTHCVRYNGGPNAGHTIYIDDLKLVTHQVPTGIIYGITCLIGPGCVVDINKLQNEIDMLKNAGIENIEQNLKISYNAHVITDKHIQEDIRTDKIGSTKCGIRPVYRDKYNRQGTRIKDINTSIICGCEVVDSYILLNKPNIKVLFEGAQGFLLDINWGKYPYVTSSQCDTGMVVSCGYPLNKISRVYGISKLYTTYVGAMKFQPEDPLLDNVQQLGKEYGSTTERKRQCDWLDLDLLIKAININGVTDLIINKCDIINMLGHYKLYHSDKEVVFSNFNKMKTYIVTHIPNNISVTFSCSKDSI
jgi:adenylosuccinate synthase